jgi:hypothetical protein
MFDSEDKVIFIIFSGVQGLEALRFVKVLRCLSSLPAVVKESDILIPL